jgi:hypothetical protein
MDYELKARGSILGRSKTFLSSSQLPTVLSNGYRGFSALE